MKSEKNKTYCQSCNKETKPPFDDYCEKCCQEDYFLMKSKKELLINCIGCGEKRCVDETGWCDNCGGEALAENIEKIQEKELEKESYVIKSIKENVFLSNPQKDFILTGIEIERKRAKQKLMDDINDCCVLDIRKRLPQIKKKHGVE